MYTLFSSEEPSDSCFVDVDGARLFCRVFGKQNEKTIIVLHGGPGLSMDYILPEITELAEKHRVIFYDQRGSGKSSGEISETTMCLDVFLNDLHVIQTHFNLDQVTLLGHSWGAYLAMQYASKYSNYLDRLILLNSIPITPKSMPIPDPNDAYEKLIDTILKTPASAESITELYPALFRHFFYDPDLLIKLNLSNMTAEDIKKSAQVHRIFEENTFRRSFDLEKQLAILNIPILIIHGDGHDIPVSEVKKIQGIIPRADLKILHTGHFSYMEEPDEVRKLITDFLGHTLTFSPSWDALRGTGQ